MTFSFGSTLLGFAYLVAACYQVLENNGKMQNYFRVSIKKDYIPLDTWKQGFQGESLLLLQEWSDQPEPLDVTWPASHMRPHGLSCDSLGRNFAITDGLSMFVAELGTKQGSLEKGIGHVGNQSLEFIEVPRCEALLGESLEDTAISCNSDGMETRDCDVVVLHRRGSRVSECPIEGRSLGIKRGRAAKLSQAWLQKDVRPEKVSSLLFDPTCTGESRLGCISVGTNLDRVARLQHSAPTELAAIGELFPDDVMPESGEDENEDNASGKFQASRPNLQRRINSRYVGILQREQARVQVLDASSNLVEVGKLSIPLKVPVEAVCIGGGHMYMMSEGPEARMWRVPLPKEFNA